ncbi:MAG TPA: VanW family protein [Anaerolineales bacterium]|nr:VanW family protein [Anaerolineales bacterium]
MSALSYPASRRAPISAQLLTVGIGGIILFLAAIFLWTLGYQLTYAGRIFPGVSVAGVDLSGLSPQDAALKLSQTLSYPISGKVLFRDGANVWVASPAELGMVFDPSSSAESAYRLGRSGDMFAALDGQLRALDFGYDVPPVIVFDQRVANQYLQTLARKINQPEVEASLHLNGTKVVAQAGQVGRTLNVGATLTYLGARLQTFTDGEVPLVIQQVQPSLMDVSSQADAARTILSQPLQLVIPDAGANDPGPWVYAPQTVANMLGVERVENGNQSGLQVLLDPDSIRQLLANIATQADRQAANAQFHFDSSTQQLTLITPSVTGRTIDIDASVKAINDAVVGGQHTVPLVMQETQPAVPDNATAEQLGITQLIEQQTTYFYGSPAARIQNIQTAASRFDGVLVAPGETFSMGQTLGDISLNNGYAEALIIYGNQTITGVGGGVCQVSTTLFRTVLNAGFPVAERVPHAYRVSYYEETSSGSVDPNLAGMDATVYFPLVDFKFTNDSPYWILMETHVGSDYLTWQFYSTPDGRSVTINTTGPQNIVPAPPPSFVKNPDLPSNVKMQQTDYAVNGADVNVTRTVMKNGAVYFQDNFQTHYEPWAAVCEYAPSVQDPAAEAKHEGKCQPPALSMVQ